MQSQQTKSHSIRTIVQLKWINRPADVEISAGKYLYIPCSADGHPEPKIMWTKLNDEGTSQADQDFGRELRIDSVKESDSGTYTCRASNGGDDDLVSRIKIDVRGK